jgi:hypothetical protein
MKCSRYQDAEGLPSKSGSCRQDGWFRAVLETDLVIGENRAERVRNSIRIPFTRMFIYSNNIYQFSASVQLY